MASLGGRIISLMVDSPKLPQLVIIGYTNIDVNVTPSKTTTSPGGAAYFVSVAASKLTSPVGLVTRIGKDFESTFLLSRVLPDGVHRIPDKLTARSTQIYHSDQDLTDRDIQLEWGVAPDICPADIPEAWLKSAKHFHVGTMPPLQQQQFIHFLKQNSPQASLSVDTDIFLLGDKQNLATVKANFSQADLVFVNRREYQALRQTVNLVPQAVVKLDSQGAHYLEKGEVIMKAETTPVAPIDVTGAGDIFAGVFLAQRINGLPIAQALRSATDEATLSVTQVGIDHLFENR